MYQNYRQAIRRAAAGTVTKMAGNWRAWLAEAHVYKPLFTLEALEKRQLLSVTPVAEWKLIDGSGATATDSSPSAANGTIQGSGYSWTTSAKIGGEALDLGVSGAYVSASDANLPSGNAARSVSLWYNTSDLASAPDNGQAYTLFSYGAPSYNNAFGIYLTKNADGTITAVWSQYGTGVTGTIPLAANSWNNLAVTYDGSTAALYVNGVLDQTGSFSLATSTGSGTLADIGRWIGVAQPAPGALDDVRVYDTTLSTAEIASLAGPTVSATASDGAVMLNWTVGSGATSNTFDVFRSTTPGGEGTTPYASGITGTSYTDTAVTNGTRYYYTVEAVSDIGSPTPSAEVSALPLSKVAWWPLNDGSGTTVADTTVYAENGTIQGSGYSWTTSARAGGEALDLGTSGAYVSADDTNLPSGNAARTVSLWYNTSALASAPDNGQVYTLFSYGAASSNNAFGIYLIKNTDGTITADWSQFGTGLGGTIALTTSSWNNLAVTFDGSTAKLYINGVLDQSGAFSLATSTGSGTAAYIGRWVGDAQPAPGAFDDVRVYDSALTAGQVAVLTGPTISATSTNATVTVSWPAVSGATSYDIYRSTVQGDEDVSPYEAGVTSTTFTDTQVTNGITYYYKVAAVDALGEGALSNEAVGTPQVDGSAVGWWKLVDGSGTSVLDYSGNDNTASIVGAGSSWSSSARVGAAALTLGSDGAYVEAADTQLPMGNSARTVALWYDTTALASAAPNTACTLFSYGSGTTGGSFALQAFKNSAGIIHLEWTRGDGGSSLTGTIALAANTWNHLAVTYSAGTITLYVNGIQDSSLSGLTLETAGGDAFIGAFTDGSSYLNPGTFDDVRVYAGALTADQIAMLVGPTGLSATSASGQVTLSWNPVAGATGYDIYRSTTPTGVYSSLYEPDISTATYTDTAAANGATYYYAVVPIGTMGTGTPTSIAFATPRADTAPIADWPLTDGSGSAVADTSGNGNTGMIQGTGSSWTTAAEAGGEALDLGSSGAFVSIADANLPSGNAARTVSLWYNTSALASAPDNGQVYTLFSYGAASVNNGFGIYLTKNGDGGITAVWTQYCSGLTGTIALTTSSWNNLAVTFDGSTADLYVNGVLDQSGAFSLATTTGSGTSAYIGRWIGDAQPAPGSFNDVRVYNYTLSPSQIASVVAPATVVSAAEATLLPNNTSATLTVGASASSGLTYTWSTIAKPADAEDPLFSENGTTAASGTTATLGISGTYQFQVLATDSAGNSVTSTVTITVPQVFTRIYTWTPVPMLSGGAEKMLATAFDQFGFTLPQNQQPPFTWTASGPAGGSFGANGLYTAGSGSGTETLIVSSGSISTTCQVQVFAPNTALTLQPSSTLDIEPGNPITSILGTVYDTEPGANFANFTATVNWGDGTATQSAMLSPEAGYGETSGAAGGIEFAPITSNHTYAAIGDYTITLSTSDGAGHTATQTLVADVEQQYYLVPGPSSQEVTVTFSTAGEYQSSNANNQLGVFEVNPADSSINGILPGQSGYAAAAMNEATDNALNKGAVLFRTTSPQGSTYTLTVPGGTALSFLLVNNNTITEAEALNPGDSIDLAPPAWFVSSAANPDGNYNHFKTTMLSGGSVQYNVEDAAYGFDQLFKNMVFTVSSGGPPYFTSTAPTSFELNPYGPLPTTPNPQPAWGAGDLFVGTDIAVQNGSAEQAEILVYSPSGQLLQTLLLPTADGVQVAPAVFDQDGNLYATTGAGNKVAEWNAQGQYVGTVWGPSDAVTTYPDTMSEDGLGNLYFADDGRGFSSFGPPFGNLGGVVELAGADTTGSRSVEGAPVYSAFGMDLESDQHTLLYSSIETDDVYSLDLNTGVVAPNPVITMQPGVTPYGLRVLQDGTILVATSAGPQRYSASGQWLETYSNVYCDFINLDPDGKSFWIASANPDPKTNDGFIYRYDIATGALLDTIEVPGRPILGGIATYEEPTAANTPVGAPFTYQAQAVDPAGEQVTYSLVGNTNGATIDPADGLMSWTPTTPGSYTFRIRATNSDGTYSAANDQTFTVVVSEKVTAPEQAPVINTKSLTAGAVGITYEEQIDASDPDGDALHYSLINSGDATISPDSGILSFTPTIADANAGGRQVTVQVSDGRGGVAQETLFVPVNTPVGAGGGVPIHVNPPASPLTATAGQLFTYATSPSGSYSIDAFPVSFPAGMTIDSGSGEVSWIPSSNQTGDQEFTVGFKGNGGQFIEYTYTVTVAAAPLGIDQIVESNVYKDAAQTIVDNTAEIFTAETADGTTPTNATYTWSVTGGPTGAPAPIVTPGENGVGTAEAQFFAAGDYTLSLVITDSAGPSQPYTEPIGVGQVATQVVATPPVLSVATNGTVSDLSGVVYDQFGNVMDTAPDSVEWSAATGQVNQNEDGTWSYTATSTPGTDNLQLSVSYGQQDLTSNVPVAVGSSAPLAGIATTGMVVTSGESTDFAGHSASYGYLAEFIDPDADAGTDPSDYIATIHWGDGQTSTGTITPDDNTNLPPSVQNQMFFVSGIHSYAQEGLYNFSIDLTAPGGHSVTIAAPTGQGITAESPGVTLTPVPIHAYALAPFTGTIATFTDPSTTATGADFQAVINWGDGTSSDGSVTRDSDGIFVVTGAHTYAELGYPSGANVAILEQDDGSSVPDATAILRASTDLSVRVDEQELTVPTGLTAVPISSSEVEVTWNDDGYGNVVLQRINPDGSVTTLSPSDPETDSAVSPYYDSEDLSAGTQYGYQVVAEDSWGNVSQPSAPVYATTWSSAAAPTGVTATPAAGNLVTVTWTDNRNDTSNPANQHITGWDVLRAAGNGTNTPPAQDDFQSLVDSATTGNEITVAQFNDDTVQPNTQYWYEVEALTYTNQPSPPSAPTVVMTPSANAAPTAPTNLAAGYAGQASTTSGGPGRVELTWDAVQSTSLLGYDVYGSTAATFATNASTLIGSSQYNYYVYDVATPGQTWYYVVKAVNDNGIGGEVSSLSSNVASVDTGVAPTASPNAPSNLRATDVEADQVSLTWDDNSLTETEFDIYRVDDGTMETPTMVGRVTADQVTFTDTSAQPDTTYDYFVKAHNEAGDTAANTITVTTSSAGPAPAQATGLTEDTSNTTYNQIALSWTASTVTTGVAVAGYYVYRRAAGSTNPLLRLNEQPVTSTSYVDSNVAEGSYEYQVVAVSTENSPSVPDDLPSASTEMPASTAPPTVQITAPAAFTGMNVNFSGSSDSPGGQSEPDGRITTLTPVTAIIDDPNNNAVSWSLILQQVNVAPNGNTANITIATGTASAATPVGTERNADGTLINPDGDVIFTLDPTQYANGNYNLILQGTDSAGLTAAASSVLVSLYSQTKLGNLNLSFTDLTVNVPGGQPLTVTRTYNSSQANVFGDFGYGWSLVLSNATVTTTATEGSGDYGSGVSFRVGDLVYITLPDGEQHVFQFLPVPDNYDPTNVGANPYGGLGTYTDYYAQFVCVDGSGATLTVPGDINSPVSDRLDLQYVQSGDNGTSTAEFVVDTEDGGQVAYNPANPLFGNEYAVKTANGDVYDMDADTGAMNWSKDANGNETTYSPNSVSQDGMTLQISRDGPNGAISDISLVYNSNGYEVQQCYYSYDQSGNLVLAEPLQGKVAYYTYSTVAGQSHYLAGITDADSSGPNLTATYAGTPPQLSSLTDSLSNTVPVGTPDSDGSTGSQTVSNPSGGGSTQDVYDAHGNVIRAIQTLTDSSGNITGYSVTVTDYNYFSGDISDEITNLFSYDGETPGQSSQNALESEINYAPFTVTTLDAAYSQQPTQMTKQVDYYEATASPNDVFQPQQEIDYLPGGQQQVTAYSGYSAQGQPGTVTTSIVNAGGTVTPISSSISTYDQNGNLTSQSSDGGQTWTDYTYTTAANNPGVPVGLLLATTETDSTGAVTTLTTNTYYSSSDTAAGAFAGQVEYSTDAAGQKTFYAYDPYGNPVLDYTLKTWTTSSGSSLVGWVGTTTTYDLERADSVTDSTYLDAGDGVLHTTLSGDAPAVNTTLNASYASVTESTSHYDFYNGNLDSTTNQFGQSTSYVYDADGRTVETTNPDGTYSITVYDGNGNVAWQTQPFTYGSTDMVATHTLYDSLGRVTMVQQCQDVNITCTGESGSATTQVVDPGTPYSTTTTVYNDQGQVAETDSPSGLRTGTIYNLDGSVAYTGPLLSSAPAGWYESLTPTSTAEAISAVFASTTSYAYDQLDTSTGNPWSGLMYNSTTDADGHTTETFTDSQGRTIFTVYADNSFTQTLYSVDDTAVPGYSITTASGSTTTASHPTIPTGGTETVNIAQRKLADPAPPIATIDIYDASGNLVDVYEPPVEDATTGLTVSPHTHYGYDASGDETSQTDAEGNVTTFAYDQNGNEVSRTLPDGQSESYTYNQYGQVATHTDFDGNTATYNYGTWVPASDVYQITYTPAPGSSAAAQTVTYSYDNFDRPSTTTITENGTNATTTDSYDQFGNLTQEQTPEGTINYLYDPATGEHTETTTADTDTVYGYNAQGELTTVTVKTLNGSTLSTPLVTTYTYDPAGNTTSETLPDGGVTTYAYDNLNRLTQQTETQGSQTVFSETLLLNDDGTRASAEESQLQPDGSTVTTSTDWTYDADQRLTGEVVTSSTAAESYSDVFAYDLNANRANETHTTGGAATNTSYTYNGNDELTSQTATTGGVATVTTNTYDANGSLTNSTVSASTGTTTTTYAYDVRNKLATVATNGTATAKYVYDDAGNRVQETAGGVTTYYLTDTANPTGYAQPLEEKSSPTAAPSRTYLIGSRIFGQVTSTGTVSYLLTDAHGSTQQITSGSGTITAAMRYTAFGNPVNFNPGSAATEYLFGGDAIYDPASGLYMNGDGTRDRLGFEFTQADEQDEGNNSDPMSLHKYLYANADPIDNSDPTGHFTSINGLSAQAQITRIYKRDHPGDTVLSGKWFFGVLPDIQDWTTKEWLEVKPFTPLGVSDAVTAIFKYAPGAIFGWLPDHLWTPSTNTIVINGQPESFFNAGGIVFYGDQVELAAETVLGISLLTARTVAEYLPRIYQLVGAGQRAVQLALGPGLENDLGIATLNGELGAV